MRASLVVGILCLIIYNANWRAVSAGDAYPARYLPFAILEHHTLLLDPIASLAEQGRGDAAFWLVHLDGGRVISLYPVVTPVLITPLYVPAVAYLHARGWTDARLDHVARVMEKLVASLLASLSAGLLHFALRRRVAAPVALLLTIAYAFGTTTWMISSQALWQHGMAQLLVIGALCLLTASCTAPRALAVGLLCGLIAGNRPPDVILAAALGAYALFWAGRRHAPLLIAGAALPLSLVLWFNLSVTGNIAGGYGLKGKPEFFEHDLLAGVAGLLFSPTRGLFVFSPFLLFLILAWRYRPRARSEQFLTMAIVAGAIVQLLLYAKTDWRTSISFGPRFLTDLVPLLVWMLAPVVAALRGAARACFALAVAIAIAIQAIGAFFYTGMTDLAIFADSGRAAWNWRNAPFVASLQDGLAPREWLTEVRGTFDAMEIAGRVTSEAAAGDAVVATGWALAGRATPAQVTVSIDGHRAVATTEFFDRPDVRETLGEPASSGWRVALDTNGLAPGEHRVTAMVSASRDGQGYFLQERKLTILSELERASRIAAARVREHQRADGYWLTSFTSGTRFLDPRPEMNTFLTALLIDLLDPIATAHDLAGSVQRARAHLTRQIEPDGLVRYHGLPTAATIGTLGCAITPDTDDTALAWRIAPASDRTRLDSALQTIDGYRTRDGLYRTWLAPRDRYQCLDPGADPNPADLVIQMHLLLLLSEVRPAAGRALCEAMQPVVDDDRAWTYYRATPLVPMLRVNDVHRAGCALRLPASRTRTAIPEQEIWVSLVRMLTQESPRDAKEIASILRELAREDFALLRKSPPLVYHNDPSASVSRFYWSEDVGYALWLRLQHVYESFVVPDRHH